MEWSIDRKPWQLSLHFLFVDESLNTWEVGFLGLLDMDEELHVIEHVVIVCFMVLEAILFPVKDVSLYSTDETKTILIFLQRLLLLSHVSKLINNNGTNDFTNNQFDNKQVSKVKHDIAKQSINKSINIPITQPYNTGILLKSLINGVHETKV